MEADDTRRLANLVRNARRMQRLSQEQLAGLAEVPRSWLSVVELGQVQRPDRERIRAVGRVLGIDDSLLLPLAGHPVGVGSSKSRSVVDLVRELYARLDELTEMERAHDRRRYGRNLNNPDSSGVRGRILAGVPA